MCDVSAQVADSLVATVRTARLLGVRVLSSGLRSERAKTLVELGGIKPFAELKAAVAFAMGQRTRSTEADS